MRSSCAPRNASPCPVPASTLAARSTTARSLTDASASAARPIATRPSPTACATSGAIRSRDATCATLEQASTSALIAPRMARLPGREPLARKRRHDREEQRDHRPHDRARHGNARERDPNVSRNARSRYAPAPAAGTTGLRHRQQQARADQAGEQADDVREHERRRGPLCEDAGQERRRAAAERLGKRREQRGVTAVRLRIELHESSRCGTARHAHRHALHDPCREQPCDARRQREEDERDRPHDESAEDHGPATDPVRELAEQQQRRRERKRIDREHEREHEAVEAEALAVDGVQGRSEVRSQQEGSERARDDRLAGLRRESEAHRLERTRPSVGERRTRAPAAPCTGRSPHRWGQTRNVRV